VRSVTVHVVIYENPTGITHAEDRLSRNGDGKKIFRQTRRRILFIIIINYYTRVYNNNNNNNNVML